MTDDVVGCLKVREDVMGEAEHGWGQRGELVRLRKEVDEQRRFVEQCRAECEGLRVELEEERREGAVREGEREQGRKELEGLRVDKEVLKREVEMVRGEIERQVMSLGGEKAALRAEGDAQFPSLKLPRQAMSLGGGWPA